MPMYRRLSLVIVALAALNAPRLNASGADADTVPPVEPGPCLSAIAANDDDKVVADCGALIDNEKTAKADRLKALVARAAAFARKEQIDRAISEYNDALRLD